MRADMIQVSYDMDKIQPKGYYETSDLDVSPTRLTFIENPRESTKKRVSR